MVARPMPLGEYVTGGLFYLPTLGAALAAGYLVVHRRYRYLQGAHKALAFTVLATVAMVAAAVIPAALGILSRTSVLVSAFVLLGACLTLREASGTPDSGPSPPPSGRVSVVIAVAAVGAVAAYELARLRVLATQPITDIDMLGFHLPGVAGFIQTGTLWRVDQFLPYFETAQYPNSGDFLLVSVVVPWHHLAFVRFVPVPFYVMTGVGVYALALELGATRPAAATMGAAVVPVPALALLALDGLPDAIALATLAAGLVFLVRHARSRRRGELVLAGLAFGLSLGTKWYGFTAVLVVFVVWLAARLIDRRSRRRLASDGVALLGVTLLVGGIWLLRNLLESGNPIYPKTVSALGLSVFPGSRGDVVNRFGYSIADYVFKPHVLRTYIYPAFRDRVGLTGIVLVAGLVITAVASLGRVRRPRGGGAPVLVLAVVIAVVGMCLEYAITPGSAYGLKNQPTQTFANVRWLMPAIVIGAALTARAVRSLGPAGVLLELAALAGVIDAIRRGMGVSGSAVAEAVGVVALVAGAYLARRRLAGWWRAMARPRQIAAAAGSLAVIVLVAAALARLDQRRFDKHPYAGFDPTFAWVDAHAASHRRIGVTGVWNTNGLPPTLPMFGPRLGNEVAYVGQRVRHSVHLPASAKSFYAELRTGRYELLEIGLQDTDHTDLWAAAAGYRLVARSDRLALYQAPRSPS